MKLCFTFVLCTFFIAPSISAETLFEYWWSNSKEGFLTKVPCRVGAEQPDNVSDDSKRCFIQLRKKTTNNRTEYWLSEGGQLHYQLSTAEIAQVAPAAPMVYQLYRHRQVTIKAYSF